MYGSPIEALLHQASPTCASIIIIVNVGTMHVYPITSLLILLVQDLKCLVFSLMSAHFKIHPIQT